VIDKLTEFVLSREGSLTALLWTGVVWLIAHLLSAKWRDLATRIAVVARDAFWKVEQTLVAKLKEGRADGHLTAAEAKLAFDEAMKTAKAMLGLGLLGKLLAAILGIDVTSWLTSKIEGHAATDGIEVAQAVAAVVAPKEAAKSLPLAPVPASLPPASPA